MIWNQNSNLLVLNRQNDFENKGLDRVILS